VKEGAEIVSRGLVSLGDAAGGSGEVMITGEGSRWTVDHHFTVGDHGRGKLVLERAAQADVRRWAAIGDELGSEGEVTVTGKGTSWTIAHFATIGHAGKGTLIVQDDATVEMKSDLSLADEAQSAARVVVGPGGALNVAEIFRLGAKGRAVLELHPAATMTAAQVAVGERGRTSIEIGPQGAPRLSVRDRAVLAGTLAWKLGPGVTLKPGAVYPVLTAREIMGRFQTLEPPAGTRLEDWAVRHEQGAVSIVYLEQGR
jgi:T5SS/PEP-CTERM-associated repeat protein